MLFQAVLYGRVCEPAVRCDAFFDPFEEVKS